MSKKEMRRGMRTMSTLLESELWPSEFLTVSGVSADTLATWYKRRILPPYDFPDVTPGHGKRRSYTMAQAVVLAIARPLIDLGLPIGAALAFASFEPIDPRPVCYVRSPAAFVLSLLCSMLGLSGDEVGAQLKDEQFPLMVIWKVGSDFDYPLAWKTHGFAADTMVSFEALRDMTRKGHLSAALVLDLVLVAARMLDRANGIIASGKD